MRLGTGIPRALCVAISGDFTSTPYARLISDHQGKYNIRTTNSCRIARA